MEAKVQKLTAKEKKEAKLAQLKAQQKKLEAALAQEEKKEERKKFLPFGKTMYKLCVEKRVNTDSPMVCEAYTEFGVEVAQIFRSMSAERRGEFLRILESVVKKESTKKLLEALK